MQRSGHRPSTAEGSSTRQCDPPVSSPIALWRVNLLRVGHLVVGVGLAVVKWPLLLGHEPWELKEGTVE